MRPAALPDDPPRFALAAGTSLVRIYRPEHGAWHARRRFGPLPHARFDHHRPPPGSADDRAVWYASTSLLGAVAEAFGSLGLLDRAAGRRIAVMRVERAIALIDLIGTAARAFGWDQRVATSTDFERTQAFARAIYERYPSAGGLRWRGRQSGSVCMTLNDRVAMTAMLALESDHEIADPEVWARVARAARACRLIIAG